jgi:type IV pilus assembly protein PilC
VFKSFGGETAGAHAGRDRDVQVLRRLVVGDLRHGFGGGLYFFFESWKRSEKMQMAMDRLLLRMPVFGDLINKSVIARWTRTLSTMFAAGVPLVEALDSVGGASGNAVYRGHRADPEGRLHRLGAHHLDDHHRRVPDHGAADGGHRRGIRLARPHAGQGAEFYEDEVDEMVKGLSSLMEPFIIVILGTLIGGIVVAMYLPIFKLGAVV